MSENDGTPTHGIRCNAKDYATIAEWLKKAKRTWAFLISTIAAEIREKGVLELHEVFKKVSFKEDESRLIDNV